ncbi:UPF0160 protein myg1, mitochondrial, partial [Xenoophorus captivus]
LCNFTVHPVQVRFQPDMFSLLQPLCHLHLVSRRERIKGHWSTLPISPLMAVITPRSPSLTFAENFHSLCPEKPWVTKLSSAGLVYLHFGHRLLAQLTQMKEDDRQLEVLFDKLYENFVEEVDAVDNGISQYDGEARYAVSSTLSARVAHLNPRWNSKSQDTEEGFRKALKMVGEEFLDRLDFYKSSWLPARAVVERAVKERHKVTGL